MPYGNLEYRDENTVADPIPFPTDLTPTPSSGSSRDPSFDLSALPGSAEQVFDALADMSRRIDDLARELNCLGYFDGDDDGPRAA
ncbi:MAG: hypothetical protein HKO59_03225 [Phycisphaerales bacterium]|nr:hypothetical protein [Phycisphaerae bacterium]NNF41801.1 hypothetical protein [Phycisphaerales bacterium]NNM24993.1 hypothetical protein [Phycisphaerales bacterium]